MLGAPDFAHAALAEPLDQPVAAEFPGMMQFGAKPVHDARLGSVCDSRLDNRPELARRLSRLDRGRRAAGDAGYVLAAYEEWGARSVERLLGDFALAVWDGGDGSLLLACDPMGARPLYFHAGERRFAFASTLEQLFRVLSRWLRADADAGATASREPNDLPAHLPGIDLVAGLRRAGGRAGLYRRLLAGTIRDLESSRSRLQAALAFGDGSEARTLLHTVKGTAGTVGAQRLADAACGACNDDRSTLKLHIVLRSGPCLVQDETAGAFISAVGDESG